MTPLLEPLTCNVESVWGGFVLQKRFCICCGFCYQRGSAHHGHLDSGTHHRLVPFGSNLVTSLQPLKWEELHHMKGARLAQNLCFSSPNHMPPFEDPRRYCHISLVSVIFLSVSSALLTETLALPGCLITTNGAFME